MKYYQVKKEFDGSMLGKTDNFGIVKKYRHILVANDLYTTTEFNEIVRKHNILRTEDGISYSRPEIAFNIVEQSAKDNEYFYSCRFPNNPETVKIIEPAIEEAKREFYNKAF